MISTGKTLYFSPTLYYLPKTNTFEFCWNENPVDDKKNVRFHEANMTHVIHFVKYDC
jgi:hypothetical protein